MFNRGTSALDDVTKRLRRRAALTDEQDLHRAFHGTSPAFARRPIPPPLDCFGFCAPVR
jgi:hypothetical protein